jgi:hypothetical protein
VATALWRSLSLTAAWLVVGSTSCAIDSVTFSQNAPPPQEDCAVVGDEDGNGKADCDDEVCLSVPACQSLCGNGKVERGESCDDGKATARCDIDCTPPVCGDGILNLAAGEEVEPPTSASMTVPINRTTCRYDFSAITQLYCSGSCGTWGGGNGCQQQDADAFCKLKTGDATAVAAMFTIGTATATPGICCPSVAPSTVGCTDLGPFPDRGVPQGVGIHETSLMSTHGAGATITNILCALP